VVFPKKIGKTMGHPNKRAGALGDTPLPARAAADATVALANSETRANCTEAKKLIEQTYGTIATTFDPRYGFSKQTE